MKEEGEHYLGDGLYASHDGFMFKLRAPRQPDDHWVGLEPEVMLELFCFVRQTDPLLFDTITDRARARDANILATRA